MWVINMNVESIRQFNRYYARILGIFDQNYLGMAFSVTEVRVLGEIGRNEQLTAQMLSEYLNLDKSYLSRLIRKLETADLIYREKASEDGRKLYLHLTQRGIALNQELDDRANDRIAQQLAALDNTQCERLTRAMGEIREILLPILPDGIEESFGG